MGMHIRCFAIGDGDSALSNCWRSPSGFSSITIVDHNQRRTAPTFQLIRPGVTFPQDLAAPLSNKLLIANIIFSCDPSYQNSYRCNVADVLRNDAHRWTRFLIHRQALPLANTHRDFRTLQGISRAHGSHLRVIVLLSGVAVVPDFSVA